VWFSHLNSCIKHFSSSSLKQPPSLGEGLSIVIILVKWVFSFEVVVSDHLVTPFSYCHPSLSLLSLFHASLSILHKVFARLEVNWFTTSFWTNKWNSWYLSETASLWFSWERKSNSQWTSPNVLLTFACERNQTLFSHPEQSHILLTKSLRQKVEERLEDCDPRN